MNRKEENSVDKGATLKATMTAWAELGSFILLFVASIAYVSLGGPFAHEASPILEPETSIEAVALKTANADIAPQVSSGSIR